MAVIINELEVVAEAPPEAEAPAASASQSVSETPNPPALRPIDLADVLERRARLEWRVFAH